MSEIISRIDPGGEEFNTNFKHNKALADELRQRQEVAAFSRSERVIERQRDRGKLLVHERIDALLDQDSPFL
ncbi:MAG: methylcrotonoyl-CoA carboxylase, partial [Candidatus Promineifilaceae bacterium]